MRYRIANPTPLMIQWPGSRIPGVDHGIGKGGIGIGAAFGKGRVYAGGRLIGGIGVPQLSVGFQAGGQSFSQMIFFENKRALDEFTSGNFDFGADGEWRQPGRSVCAGSAVVMCDTAQMVPESGTI